MARMHDLLRDAIGEPLLAVFADHASDLVLMRFGQPVLRRHAQTIVHAHIERTIVRKAEPARGVIKLRR